MEGEIDSQGTRIKVNRGEHAHLLKLMVLALPAFAGAWLLAGTIRSNSATYDEIAYARIACHWWRGGSATEITRMGSPVSFWKWQSAPALALLDATGRGSWIEDPRGNLPALLPWLRASSAWLWLLGLAVVQTWAARAYGYYASLFAGFVYVMSPNLRAHGALMTMETPLWAFVSVSAYCLSERIRTGKRFWTVLSAIGAGVAFSMKFTAVALPVLFGIVLFGKAIRTSREIGIGGTIRTIRRSLAEAVRFELSFVSLMILTNLILTGFATIAPSERTGRHPWLEQAFDPAIARPLGMILETAMPVDWVGFATQMRHQKSGGPGYLLGETSDRGWPWYYLVAMAVKCSPVVLIGLLARPLLVRVRGRPEEWLIPFFCLMFVTVACAASKRNYGYRYLLPLAPLAIVWLSALTRSRAGRYFAGIVTIALAWASLACHPYELTYFNIFGGGGAGGHRILADSNLDWGQGLICFRESVKRNPELADCTLFYFGDIEPRVWGIDSISYLIDASDQFEHLPKRARDCRTTFLAVSTSLIFGPWGPKHYFSEFVEQEPVAMTADRTIRFYRIGHRNEPKPSLSGSLAIGSRQRRSSCHGMPVSQASYGKP